MKESNKVPNPDSCPQTKVKIYLYIYNPTSLMQMPCPFFVEEPNEF